MKRIGLAFHAPMTIGFCTFAVVLACALSLLATVSPVLARPLVRVSVPPVQPDRGVIAGHLYVAGDQLSAQIFVGGKVGAQRLVRYPLVKGKAASTPDLMFPAHTDGPMALDSAGNVYSAADCMIVNVFAPNKNTIMRSLRVNVPCGDHFYTWEIIKGLAVDSAGYLFVSIHLDCVSCARPTVLRPQPLTGNPLTDCKNNNFECTLVYAPGATGTATPLFAIAPGMYSNGMAFDVFDRLYMESDQTTDVDATTIQKWRDPESDPTAGQVMSGSSFSAPTGFAIDFSQALYVNDATLNASQERSKSYIAEFLADEYGNISPLRTITPSPAQLLWYGLAVDPTWIYTGTGQQNLLHTTPTLETFHKGGNGNVAPTYTQTITIPEDPAYVAVGP